VAASLVALLFDQCPAAISRTGNGGSLYGIRADARSDTARAAGGPLDAPSYISTGGAISRAEIGYIQRTVKREGLTA
jgi:hypothetical protein